MLLDDVRTNSESGITAIEPKRRMCDGSGVSSFSTVKGILGR
jgi:hypothetical protein